MNSFLRSNGWELHNSFLHVIKQVISLTTSRFSVFNLFSQILLHISLPVIWERGSSLVFSKELGISKTLRIAH